MSKYGDDFSRALVLLADMFCARKNVRNLLHQISTRLLTDQSCCDVPSQILVKVPIAIQRTHTELLEALSKTVGVDETAPHFSLIDDPALIPSDKMRLKDCYLAKEMGRRAAQILAAEWPTLFQYDEDEPRLNVFRPTRELDPENAELSENNVIKLLDTRRIRDAIKLYERMASEGIDVSKETLKRLFLLSCYYNGSNAPDSEVEEWHGLRNFGIGKPEEQKPFERGGIVDLLFETLDKSEDVYSAMIAGLCKYPSAENISRAKDLYEKMKSEKLKLHHEGYCGLVRNAQSFEEACSICKEMSKSGIRPNIQLFNSLLEAVLNDDTINREEAASRVLEEARTCSCKFSLTTFRNILKISEKESDQKVRVAWLVHVIEQLENMDSLEAVIAKEQLLFVDAMRIAYLAKNVLIGGRILALYNSPKNHAKLPELTDESTLYNYYLRLSIPTVPIQKLDELYRSLIPRVLGTSRFIGREMLDRLKIDFKWSLFRRVTEDNINARNLLDAGCMWKNCDLIGSISLKDLTADEREECRELAVRIVGVLDSYSKFPGLNKQKWNPKNLVLCSSMLLNVGEREKAVELLRMVLDESLYEGDDAIISVVGFPYRKDVMKVMNTLSSYGDWESACYCLEIIAKYSSELRLNIAEIVHKLESSCKLTEMQKTVLKNFSNSQKFQ